MMHRAVRALTLAVAGAAALTVGSTSAAAQLDTTHTWRGTITPYMWLSQLTGRVGVGPVSSSVFLSPADILNMLKFAAMGYGELRYGPWVFSTDAMYVSTGAGSVFAIRGDTGRLELTQSETMVQPMFGYTFGDFGWGVDLLGGFRYWDLSATLDVDRAVRPSNQHSGGRHWLDATTGLRARWIPIPKVRFTFDADAGAGGSKGTWQLYSSLGYDVWRDVSLGVAYRALAVDYDHDNFLYDTNTQGFLFGVTARFR